MALVGEAAGLERDGLVLVESLINGHGQLLVLVIDVGNGQCHLAPDTLRPGQTATGNTGLGWRSARPGQDVQPAKLRQREAAGSRLLANRRY